MSAMLKPFAPWSLSEAVVSDFVRKGVQVEIVNVQSSVELAPITGLADLIDTFNEDMAKLNDRMFTFQDYAVIGRKQ